MNNEDLKQRLLNLLPAAEVSEGNQYLTVIVPDTKLHAFATALKQTEDLSFDYLFCLSGVDWENHLSVVYHLESTLHNHTLVMKVNTKDRVNPELDTVCDIWRTAEFHEREVFDLLGVNFKNHPDMRRIFLEDFWVGHPLRKDYIDEVNIVER